MKFDRDYLTFSTGKRIPVASATVGIKFTGDEEFGDQITIHEGSVAPIYIPGESIFTKDALTSEECIELADAAIARWEAFKRQYKRGENE